VQLDENHVAMNGGLVEDADMNRKELGSLPHEKEVEPFTLRRKNFQSTRMIPIVALAGLICFVLGCHDAARDNMETMIKRAQKQCSPAELQAAVAGLCATNDSSYVEIQNLPREILALSEAKPGSAFVTVHGGGKGTLVILWGGVVSWGIGVCPPGGLLDTNLHAHVWRWSDGVFFFYA